MQSVMNERDAGVWAQREYGGADLGHKARTRRLLRVAADLIQSPAASIPKAITEPAQAKGAYRFLSNHAVNAQGILSGHYSASAKRGVGRDVLLVLQDTTTLTFNSRTGLLELGPTNDGSMTKGFFAHTSLAVAASNHEVLGVLHQHLWIRSREKKPVGETSRERKQRPRESAHWGDNQKQVAEVIQREVELAEAPSPRIIAVFDREGDVFEAMETLDELGHSFVIRAVRNRLIDSKAETGTREYSLDVARASDIVAHKVVTIPARAGKPPRSAHLQIRAATMPLKPPRSRERAGQSLEVNVVAALETNVPVGVEPLGWYLITREPISDAESALAIVEHYEARWIIEEFHMALKTGCACEDRQMGSAHALQNFVALATPMAVELLRLRDAARRDTPIEDCDLLSPGEMAVARALRPKMMAKVSTARELMRVIANFGGFLNRNKDPEPGWRTLWRGYEYIKLAAIGFDLRARIDEGRAHEGTARRSKARGGKSG